MYWHLIPEVIVNEFFSYLYDSLGHIEPEDYQSIIDTYNENYSSLIDTYNKNDSTLLVEDKGLEDDYSWGTFVTNIKSRIIQHCYNIVDSIEDDYYTFFFYLYCPSTQQIEEIAIEKEIIRIPRIVNTSIHTIE